MIVRTCILRAQTRFRYAIPALVYPLLQSRRKVQTYRADTGTLINWITSSSYPLLQTHAEIALMG
jgi:hypothetical protein